MFPDIANVEFIREALWRHKGIGNASIMIGAGFSRNAHPVSAPARSMPNWAEMAKALCEPLYGGDHDRYAASLNEASGTSGFLRLAQEYQVAFGRSALNGKIRNLVPDLDYQPGDLHKRLLRLPWADVFSTNWDTLLERSRADVFERSYDVVCTIDQIPYAMRPRIIKLHGTFPAHEPFIFTEEEYRRYPTEFSPFVNLVQQSMMESIFCLLGFSGDDPNFLHWAGWVRDNLTKSAPKIYLVGWLDLSVHRRRMLEERNVMPIDLAALPQAKSWPRDQRHRYATDWFLRALEEGKPYDPSDWPSPPLPPPPSPPHLAPLPAPNGPSPLQERMHPPHGGTAEERTKVLKAEVETWAHNRRLYPGWIIAPERARRMLWLFTEHWMAESLALFGNMTAFERVQTICEISWRLDRCLFPLFADFEEIAFRALDAVDRATATIGGKSIPKGADWSDLLRVCDELALSLARNGRHSGNKDIFERALAYLEHPSLHSAELRHSVSYERCLWNLGSGDLQELSNRLSVWLLGEGDTPWLLRKAGLLAELHEDHQVCSIVEKALAQIRRTRRRDIDDLWALSLESWALYLALAYSSSQPISTTSPALPSNYAKPFARWRELSIVECDAYSEYQSLLHSLKNAPPPQAQVTKRQQFDPDREGVTYHFNSGLSQDVRAAYAAILLSEGTGVPPVANHTVLFKEALLEATKILSVKEPWLASSLTIRNGPSALDHVFDRASIAALPASILLPLRDNMLSRISYGISKMTGAAMQWSDSTKAAIELLSRLCLRLSPQDLLRLFEEARSFFNQPLLRRRAHIFGQVLNSLLARILEALPSENIDLILLDLFRMPLVHDAGFEASDGYWSDPVTLLPASYVPQGMSDSHTWSETVSRLIVAARAGDKANRAASLIRLEKLWKWQQLDNEQARLFAEALWSERNDDGLPAHTNFGAWAFFSLPAPAYVNKNIVLTSYITRLIQRSDLNLFDQLEAVGILLLTADRMNISIDLPPTAIDAMERLLDAWASRRLTTSALAMISSQEDFNEQKAILGIKAILPRVILTETLISKIWARVSDLNSHRDRAVRGYELYPVLIRLMPEYQERLSTQLQRALGSDLENEARLASIALLQWTRESMESPDIIRPPSKDLFREVGIAIAARRASVLRIALEIARWLFSDGPDDVKTLIAADCEHGLSALVVEATYARGSSLYDVPNIRAASVRLALSMEQAGFGGGSGVRSWIAATKDDPLPEVRHASIHTQK